LRVPSLVFIVFQHVFPDQDLQGTVEEKVLELQKSKRDLAAAIISADHSLIRNLKREDLERLLEAWNVI